VALTLDALQQHPEAEIAVLGSPFLAQLLEAIRARAGHLSLGMLPPPAGAGKGRAALASDLPIPVRGGTARRRKSGLASHPIGRLLARVALRAGAVVEEAVVETALVDLATGARMEADVGTVFGELFAQRANAADEDALPDAVVVEPRPPEELIRLLVAELRQQSAERVSARQEAAAREVATELERLDRYFASVLKDKDDDAEIRTVTELHQRRRAEEVRRYQVKAMVHPLQLVEARVLVQRVEWELTSAQGVRARFAAHRALAGSGAWTLACPHCGGRPSELVMCAHPAPSSSPPSRRAPPEPPPRAKRGGSEGERGTRGEDERRGHCACAACVVRCTVCSGDFCADHITARCRVDEQPVCAEHARECPSCRMAHCSAHEGVCLEGHHPSCSACLEQCGSCGRVVCNRHAQQSGADAPRGSRRLCTACVRYCEGGSSEPVGADEVDQCVTCGKSVCSAHQALCVVDGQVHCARHLRHADGSRRLVCEKHRATCVAEPDAVFASDEVSVCSTCGRQACVAHSGECTADGTRHCLSHLAPLLDTQGSKGCAAHRKQCHVDGWAYSLGGAEACPVCGKDACAKHRVACAHCGRRVCTSDLVQQSKRCSTCAGLVTNGEPPEEVVAAVLKAAGASAGSREARTWRMAKDKTHLVVELDLGWRRKTVVALRHGAAAPESVVRHTMVGAKKGQG
jgi:hypothetical protein